MGKRREVWNICMYLGGNDNNYCVVVVVKPRHGPTSRGDPNSPTRQHTEKGRTIGSSPSSIFRVYHFFHIINISYPAFLSHAAVLSKCFLYTILQP